MLLDFSEGTMGNINKITSQHFHVMDPRGQGGNGVTWIMIRTINSIAWIAPSVFNKNANTSFKYAIIIMY